ncbi:uncharacterized protein WM277_024817 isoform 2-T2 [Molossus nigricans]
MWKKLQGNSKKIPQKAIRALTCVSECSRAGEEKTGSEWMMERDDSRENGTCEANVWSVGSHSHEAGQGYVSRCAHTHTGFGAALMKYLRLPLPEAAVPARAAPRSSALSSSTIFPTP